MFPRTLLSSVAGLLFCAAGLMLDAAPAVGAWPHDPRVGVPISVSEAWRSDVVTCSDGAGGIYLAWADPRTGPYRIYAQHVGADGTIAPGWPPTGLALRAGSPGMNERLPSLCSNGSGGAFVAFHENYATNDTDIYAQQVSEGGELLWGDDAVAVCFAGGMQAAPECAPDGAGGVFIAWPDERAGNSDIYAQHLTGAGSLAAGNWTADGIALCSETGSQHSPVVAADGFGGLNVGWIDLRNSPSADVFGLRVTGEGVVSEGWTTGGTAISGTVPSVAELQVAANDGGGGIYVWSDNRAGNFDLYGASFDGNAFSRGTLGGTLICDDPSEQYDFNITPDGQGGVYVGWSDERNGSYDVFLQRLNGSGFLAAGWPDKSDAVGVCTVEGDNYTPELVADGTGGVLLAWTDQRVWGRNDIYAGHILGNTSVGEGWSPAGGVLVCSADMSQFCHGIVSDGAGGAIVAWLDERNGYIYDLYGQRIERFGRLGDPQPSIVSVRDVPNDQGGQLRVSWNASYVDAYPDFGVAGYRLWRQVPAGTALSAIAAGARLLDSATDDSTIPRAGTGLYRTTTVAAATWYWELADEMPANGYPGYSLTAGTPCDSIGGSNPCTVFLVEARGTTGEHVHWDSAPDSGYSVDNLPPAPPAPFTGAYVVGATHLHWGANAEPDLAGYRVYRGTTGGFVPGPANLAGEPPDTGFVDTGPAGRWYKLTAVDSHGNESPVAVLGPDGTTDAPDAPLPAELVFAGASPNPFRGETALRFALPRGTHVRLMVFDAAGRRVRTLADGSFPAGEHVARWDGCDTGGSAVSSGLYFVRFEAEGRRFNARVLAIR